MTLTLQNIEEAKETIKNNGTVRGFLINNLLSRSELDNLDKLLKNEGSPGLGWFKIENKKVSGAS